MAALDSDVISPIAQQLLECLRDEVAKVSEPPAKVGLRTGNLVAKYIAMTEDECCKGLAWVRWAGGFPSEALGEALAQPPTGGKLKQVFWTLQFELGVSRCSPVGTARKNPSAAQWNEVSELVFEDQAAMLRTYCCFNALPGRAGHTLITTTEPEDTEGGCTGSIMQFMIRGPLCAC